MYNLSEKAIAEKYEDLLFTKVMALYAAEESEKILSEIENEEPADPKNIEKIFSKTERRKNFSVFWKVSKKLITFAAMVVFVAVVSLSSVVVASAEAREAVAEAIYHLVLRKTDRYTEVSIGNSTGFFDPEIYTWDDAYGMTYVPKGFVCTDKQIGTINKMVTYSCDERFFIFSQSSDNTFARIDTEDADTVEKFIINNSEAIIVEKNGFCVIAWRSGDTFLSLQGIIEAEELIKIAEGIKPLGKTKTEEYEFVDPEIYTWDNAYGMTYVPENFIFINSDDLGSSQFLNYRNGEKVLSFIQSTDTSSFVDSENADSIKNIIIGTSEALLITKSDWSCISWTLGNKLLQLSGNVSTEEIIKVAEGIKPLGKTEEPAEEYEFIDAEVFNWEGAYAPTYIPEGYIFDEKQELTTRAIITYSNGNSYFTITQSNKTASLHMDTEDADSISEVMINNSQGILVEKDGFSSLAWNVDENFFWVRGEIESAELTKVAEGIKPIN